MNRTAGVIAPPPLLYLGGMGLGLLLDRLLALPPLPLEGLIRWATAVLLLAAGSALIMAALGRFRAADTPPEPWKPTQALTTAGIYTRTRNPMYLGMALILLAAAMAFASLGILLTLPLVVFVIDRFVIAREERYLAGLFGAEFELYRKQVRRWF